MLPTATTKEWLRNLRLLLIGEHADDHHVCQAVCQHDSGTDHMPQSALSVWKMFRYIDSHAIQFNDTEKRSFWRRSDQQRLGDIPFVSSSVDVSKTIKLVNIGSETWREAVETHEWKCSPVDYQQPAMDWISVTVELKTSKLLHYNAILSAKIIGGRTSLSAVKYCAWRR